MAGQIRHVAGDHNRLVNADGFGGRRQFQFQFGNATLGAHALLLRSLCSMFKPFKICSAERPAKVRPTACSFILGFATERSRWGDEETSTERSTDDFTPHWLSEPGTGHRPAERPF